MGADLPDVDLGEGFLVDYVDLGDWHTCVFSLNQTVKCFGYGANGKLGTGDNSNSNLGDGPGEMGDNLLPLVFPGTFVPAQLSAGAATSCVVSEDYQLACWGAGNYGIIGQGNSDDANVPTLVDLGNFNVEFVSVGYYSNCAVSTSDDVKVCIGSKMYSGTLTEF